MYKERKVPTYAEIKLELMEISEIIKTFPENIQADVYKLLVSSFTGIDAQVEPRAENKSDKDSVAAKNSSGKKTGVKKKAPAGNKQSYSIIKDLDLRGGENQSFIDFVEEKAPSSAIEFNTVSVYYLKETLGKNDININHINTCYKEAKRKPPGDFLSSMRDTSSNKYGYIDFSNKDDIQIPHRGTSFVEHDLPKKKKK